MADDFGAFNSAFSQPPQKEGPSESAWASWPDFQDEPPPIDDFDDDDDDEFGTFASSSNTATSLERGNSVASVSTPDSALPPLPNGGWAGGSQLSTPMPDSEELNIDELAKEIDAIGKGISLTLPTSLPGEDGSSFVASEGKANAHQDLEVAEHSEPLAIGLDQSGLPVAPPDNDFGGFVPAMSLAEGLQIGSDTVSLGALPDATFSEDLGSISAGNGRSKGSVGCNEFSVEKDFSYQGNDCESLQQPPKDEFGDFGSSQQPSEDKFGDFGSSQQPPKDEFGDFGSSQQPPEDDFGDFGSSQQPPEDDFGDFGSSQQPPEDDFGSSQQPPKDEFGDFGSSQQPPEDDFGDFGSSQQPPEDDFGDFGSSQPPPEDEFGDFGSAAPTQMKHSGESSAASDTVQETFGNFSSASTSDLNSTKPAVSAAKPSTSLPAKEATLDLLNQCFPGPSPCELSELSLTKLHEQALNSGLWQAYRESRDVSATTKVYHWEYSDIQDKFYYSAHVDPAMAPAMSTQQLKSALQMEDFSLLLTANKDTSSSPISSPPGTPTTLTSVLLDLSFQSAESAHTPSQNGTKEMVTLDADLLGLDLTASVQEPVSENIEMELEDSLRVGGALAPAKVDAAASQGEADDSFSSFVHATPMQPSHKGPPSTGVVSYTTTASKEEEEEDEFTSFSSAEPTAVPFSIVAPPLVTADPFGAALPVTSITEFEASGDSFSDFTSAPPPITPYSDHALPSGATGTLSSSSAAKPTTSSSSSFTSFPQLAKPPGMLSEPASYSSNGSVPSSQMSVMFPTLATPSNSAPTSTTAVGTVTVSSPEPLTPHAQQLFDRIPDVRFMLSNVLLSPKSFL